MVSRDLMENHSFYFIKLITCMFIKIFRYFFFGKSCVLEIIFKDKLHSDEIDIIFFNLNDIIIKILKLLNIYT